MTLDSSRISLVFVNLIPLIGIFVGWSLFHILFFYWFESFAIGFFNIIKMYMARGLSQSKTENSRAITIITKIIFPPFFMVHYGGFMFVHLIFVFFIGNFSSGVINFDNFLIDARLMVFPALFLFLSHGYSFFRNFIGKKEYEKISIVELMVSPYKRVIVMHFTLILGGFIIAFTKAPIYILILFISLKIMADLKSHTKEHSHRL